MDVEIRKTSKAWSSIGQCVELGRDLNPGLRSPSQTLYPPHHTQYGGGHRPLLLVWADGERERVGKGKTPHNVGI